MGEAVTYDPAVGLGRDRMGHRWSGWPGAWCHYCAIADQDEIALADGADVEDLAVNTRNPVCFATAEQKEKVDRHMNPEAFK